MSHRSRGSTRAVLLLAAALLLALAIGSAVLVGSSVVKLPILPASSGPRLAYETDGDIYLADWDGSHAVRVADGVGPDGDWECRGFGGEGTMWAPDGRHFAYRKEGGDACSGEVHVRDAEGRLVASIPGSGWDISWSPDSTHFATWVELFETIGIYDLEGQRLALLPVPPGCANLGDHDPLWSPDGTSVIVTPCEVPIDGSTPGILSLKDPRIHDVSTGRSAWSPDRTHVAYVSSTGDSETFDSSIVIADASGAVLLVIHEDTAPSPWYRDLVWSPSGGRILFGRDLRTSDGGAVEAASELRQIDIGTGEVTTIAAKPGIKPIRFSPDGDRILFATWDGSHVGQERYTGLWRVDADGSHAQLMVPNAGFGDWQPLPGSD